MHTQAKVETVELLQNDEKTLQTYVNRWFLPQCCWKVPNLKDMQQQSDAQKKAVVTKAVIALRQSIEVNDSSIADYEPCRNRLARAQLDAWALEFGFANQSMTKVISDKLAETKSEFERCQQTISSLNLHLGHRIAGTITLQQDGKGLKFGSNLLTVMHVLKRHETILNHGKTNAELLKYTISLYTELGQREYSAVINKLIKELKEIHGKIIECLGKMPPGLLGPEPVKAVVAERLKAFKDDSDPRAQLIHSFDSVADIFCELNRVVARKLSCLALPLETQHNIFSIVPSHSPQTNAL